MASSKMICLSFCNIEGSVFLMLSKVLVHAFLLPRPEPLYAFNGDLAVFMVTAEEISRNKRVQRFSRRLVSMARIKAKCHDADVCSSWGRWWRLTLRSRQLLELLITFRVLICGCYWCREQEESWFAHLYMLFNLIFEVASNLKKPLFLLNDLITHKVRRIWFKEPNDISSMKSNNKKKNGGWREVLHFLTGS